MSRLAMPTEFMAKNWIFVVTSLVFGGLGTYCLIFGPLFLFGIMNGANGRPATDAGIALTAFILPFLLILALAVYNLRARRRPLLRLCREGIEFVVVGSSSLDGIPLIPLVVRLAWLILSTQGFRTRFVRIPWQHFQDASVSGPPLARRLTIDVSQSFATTEEVPPGADQIVLGEDMFSTPLDQIEAAIQSIANGSMDREHLASWSLPA